MNNIQIYHGDCLEIIPTLSEKANLILADLPFGITPQKWDKIIPMEEMWGAFKHITLATTPILLFGAEPFSSKLRLSNKFYHYDWIWNKKKGTNAFLAAFRPMPSYETISVFYEKKPVFNPQYSLGQAYKAPRTGGMKSNVLLSHNQEGFKQKDNDGKRHPLQILNCSIHCGSKKHSNEKPLELLEYLILTYTNKNDLVLDCCMGGSGCIAKACMNTNRKYIGIELDKDAFLSSKHYIEEHVIDPVETINDLEAHVKARRKKKF